MGKAKSQTVQIGKCIYCESCSDLTKEHVIPYGIGGHIILSKASCTKCADETKRIEDRLLRKHWWPHRQILGLQSRTPATDVRDVPISLIQGNGTRIPGFLPLKQQTISINMHFPPPGFLTGEIVDGPPVSSGTSLKMLGKPPAQAIINGAIRPILSFEKIEIPINLSADDLCRFLAKIAHGYIIYKRGMEEFDRYLLPKYILGKSQGIQNAVGESSSLIVNKKLPGSQVHALMERKNGDYLTVYIQLFRGLGDPPPIYEVVVSRLT